MPSPFLSDRKKRLLEFFNDLYLNYLEDSFEFLFLFLFFAWEEVFMLDGEALEWICSHGAKYFLIIKRSTQVGDS